MVVDPRRGMRVSRGVEEVYSTQVRSEDTGISVVERKRVRGSRTKRLQGRRQPDVTSQCELGSGNIDKKDEQCSLRDAPFGPRLRREMLESWGGKAKAPGNANISGISWS
jgi:hypothetical protein